MNARLFVLLIILVADIGSALGIVYIRHQSRHLAVQLGELETGHDNAMAEWSRLQLEQAWLADAGQVESQARKRLQMKQPDETQILVVRK